MKRTFLNILICAAGLAGGAGTTSAQSGGGFNISLSTIDGGSGSSAGGGFSLNGTVGQPDAGTMSGGMFTVSGGFWPGVTMEGGPAYLRIQHAGPGFVLLAWPASTASHVLQGSPTVAGPGPVWTDIATPPVIVGTEKQVTLPATGIGRFFRLRGP